MALISETVQYKGNKENFSILPLVFLPVLSSPLIAFWFWASESKRNTLDSRGYFLAMKRAAKEGVAKRREKPLLQAVNPSEHAASITLRFPLPESSFNPGDFIGRSTNRFYKDCHWLSRGGRSNRFFTGVIQEDYERDSSDRDKIITNSWLAD